MVSVGVAVAEPADYLWITMVEEQRGAGVQAGDARHLGVGQLEVEDVETLHHAFCANGFRYDNDVQWAQISPQWARR